MSNKKSAVKPTPTMPHGKAQRSNGLSSYLTLTVGAAAATAMNANADIISYDGAPVTVNRTDADKWLYFDLFDMSAGTGSATVGGKFNLFYGGANYIYARRNDGGGDPFMTFAVGVTTGTRTARLADGDTIDDGLLWNVGTWTYINNNFTPAQSSWATGEDDTRGILPFRFAYSDAQTTYYYGWADFTYNNQSQSLTLNNFAYESTPDTGIMAGVVPEPSSLLLLVTGGAATLFARRRITLKKSGEAAA